MDMYIIRLISLWQRRLIHNSTLHKQDIESTERVLRKTREGRQQLREFYDGIFKKMLVIEENPDE